MASLKQIFAECQRTTATHQKYSKLLLNIYLKCDLDEFKDEFTNLLKKSLIYGDKQPAVERTLNFVALFATMKKDNKSNEEKSSESEEGEEEEEEPDMFLVNLMQFLLNNHEANSQAVRFRVCQLINKILNHMGEDAVIDDDLYSSIYDTMLHRMQDKVPAVRVQAVLAVARLQDPRNKECPVIKAYRYHLSMDPNPDVRRAVLTSTAITFQTLPDILERTRDVRDSVRKEAYKVLAQKVHIRSLTIAQRVRLISEGLKDRSDMVRTTVEKNLIQAWLRMLNASVIDLLGCLDVEASVAEAELALKTLFQDVPFGDLIDNFGLVKDERLVETSKLQPESALYWRCLAQHLKDEGAEEALDTIIPELTIFCKYIHDYAMADLKENEENSQELAVLRMERDFVTKQLVSMTMLYDFSDEVGRRSLDKLVRDLLVSDKISESLVKILVEVFGKLHPPTTRINQLAEIISEIREPEASTTVSVVRPITDEEQRKKKLQVAKIKVRINQVREEIEECAKKLDFTTAQLLKEEIEELETELSLVNMNEVTTEEEEEAPVQEERSDPETLSKCLMIVCHMMENPDITAMTPALYSINENLTLSCLRSEDPSVRNQGVKALGLFCLISVDLAKQYLVLFLQVSKIDVEQIQLTALHCLIDLLLLYGLEEFTEAAGDIEENSGTNSNEKEEEVKEVEKEEEGGVIISAVCNMLDNENVDVRTHTAEGLCKLLLASRITSFKLLSHLILMWYNPATEDDHLLRHMLGVFFPVYAAFGGSNQESLCAAVLPTLQTLFEAPSRSPLAEVDVDDVANFLISITSPSFVSGDSTEQVNTHDTLVFTLSSEILANPDSGWTKVLVRCLNHLDVTATNYSTLRQVKVLAEKMLKRVKERTCLNGLERFNTMIQNYLKNAPEQDDAEKEMIEVKVETPDVPANTTTMGDMTLMRKKRMLFQTISDFFSSEGESDLEPTPRKRTAAISKEKPATEENDEDDSLLETSVFQKKSEETEEDSKEDSSAVVVSSLGNSEIELSPKGLEGHDVTEKVSHNQKRTKEARSSSAGETSDEEIRTPTKVRRTGKCIAKLVVTPVKSGRRPRKQMSAHSEDSSEGEATIPSKVARTARTVSETPTETPTSTDDVSVDEEEEEPVLRPTSGEEGDVDVESISQQSSDRTTDSRLQKTERSTRSSISSGSADSTLSKRSTRGSNSSGSGDSTLSKRSTRGSVSSGSGDSTLPKRSARGSVSSSSVDPTPSKAVEELEISTQENTKTRSTRGSVKSAETTGNTSSGTQESSSSSQPRKSGRNVIPNPKYDDGKRSSRSRSSVSSPATSQTSSDVASGRKSQRNLACSQSTDSESDVTPAKSSNSRRSQRKTRK